MAKGEASAGEGNEPAGKPSGLLGFVIAMLVATVVSGVGGGIFGMYGLSSNGPPDKKQEKAKANDAAKQVFGDGLNLK